MNMFNWLRSGKRTEGTLNQTLWDIDVEPADVTAFHAQFDLEAISVITKAPVWMTRAERLVLFTLAFTLRPKTYLEIGTLEGGSALIVCAAMDALKLDSKIICIDPMPQIQDENWHKLEHRATLLKAFSPDALAEAYSIAGEPFDLVLVDGDHSYKGVLRDGKGVLPYCRKGAYILFHDCFFSDVKRAIDEFVQSSPQKLVDLGPLTREMTVDDQKTSWAGLRAVQVR
jgi:predicted O-methyltransferase YrrM